MYRFPSLHIGDTAKNLENRTFMKEVHDLMINRLETWDGPFYEKQGHILRLEDFIEMKRKSKHLLHSVLFAQTCVRKRLFGEFFWNDREVTLRAKEGLRLQDDLGGRPIVSA